MRVDESLQVGDSTGFFSSWNLWVGDRCHRIMKVICIFHSLSHLLCRLLLFSSSPSTQHSTTLLFPQGSSFDSNLNNKHKTSVGDEVLLFCCRYIPTDIYFQHLSSYQSLGCSNYFVFRAQHFIHNLEINCSYLYTLSGTKMASVYNITSQGVSFYLAIEENNAWQTCYKWKLIVVLRTADESFLNY